MKMNVNFSMFVGAFETMGRAAQFSYEGKRALFEYLETWEEETGEEITMDVIALCCEYREYTEEELLEEYSHLYDEDGDEAAKLAEIIDYLQDRTEVIPIEERRWIVENY